MFRASVGYTYGLGVVIIGNWLLQDPLFSEESAVEAYLPAQQIGIAVAVTYQPETDGTTGGYDNVADQLWRQIGIQLAPTDPPTDEVIRHIDTPGPGQPTSRGRAASHAWSLVAAGACSVQEHGAGRWSPPRPGAPSIPGTGMPFRR